MKYIISRGGDINATDSNKKTAAHYAAENKNLEVLKYIISRGGDIDARDDGNRAPIHYVAQN